MRNFLFLLLSLVMLASCTKWPQSVTTPDPVSPATGVYQLKSASATLAGDTLMVPINTLVVFTLEKNGTKIAATFDFGNNSPIVTGDVVTAKFLKGVYIVKAVDNTVSPAVTKTFNLKAQNAVVVTPSGETAIVVISSTFTSAGVNTITLGLRADIINGFNATTPQNAQVQYEMLPSIAWTNAPLLASDIATINGLKYYKWSFIASNGQKVRFGWLIGSVWAYDLSSIYRQSDGLYALYVKDGAISKDVITASLPGSFGDTKVRGTLTTVSGVQNLVLYFQKTLFNSGTATLKYTIDSGTQQNVALVASSDANYYTVNIVMANGQEIDFWPLSTSGSVDISGSVVWSTDKLCGRLQILNLKSAQIGGFTVKLG
ncbi:MAG: hypothetical protein WCK59_03195 [Candidatus Falkowbacteria bacterium]